MLEVARTRALSGARQYCEALPQSFLHCDTRPPHIFFRQWTGEACFVDWQRVGRGPGSADLCNLVVFCAGPGQLQSSELEEAVFASYLDAWSGQCGSAPCTSTELRKAFAV